MTVDIFKSISPSLIENEPMSKHTTFRIGGAADMFVNASSAEEIARLIKAANENSVPFIVIGNGSNMLVGDKGIRGLVIRLGEKIAECEVIGNIIKAGAGVQLSKLASVMAREELSGFETLSGIPGTLGGAIYMNAGAYGGEIKDVVHDVTYVNNEGNINTISASECRFGYRSSVFCGGGKYIVSATLELEKGNYDKIKADMADYNKRRADKQPLSMPSAGSTFKRPEGHFAGKLIQDAGLMGYSVGGAQVSDKHAGFVVNKGGATAADVLALIEHIRSVVRDRFGVALEPEVRLIGEM